MQIRRLGKEDLDKVSKIYKESFGSVTSKIVYNDENIYVVTEKNEILGLCAVDYINDIFKSKKIAYINSVCVSKDYHKKGVATYMMKEIEKICMENNVNEIMLTSSEKRVAANNLYKKLDYKIYDTNVYKKKI